MPAVINEYARQKGLDQIRLHLGCGGHYLPDYINIDKYDMTGPDSSRTGALQDIQMDIRSLDAEEGTVDEILLVHVLEHFVRWDALRLIAQFHRLLRFGGTLSMETPDLDGCIEWYLKRTETHQTPLGELNMGFTQFYGNQWDELDYETHRYVWTKREMRSVLEAAGFRIIHLDNKTRWHHPGRDMRVLARKRRES
jgi:predicted SAM-dependent methyltransferase